jgi:NAD(P)-dependent dehydrogenase (short-subunit alcohol dehydrogenase family)
MSVDPVRPRATLDPAWLDRLAPARLFSLEGRVAIVTGAAGGIGRWLAAGFGLAGAKVLVTDRQRDPSRDLAAALRDAGVDARPLCADLADESAPGRIVGGALEAWGRVDILVNNARIHRRIAMLEVTRELLDTVWRIDFIRAYELSQMAARQMIDQGGGAIIHVGSVNTAIGLEDVSLMGPAKAALTQLAKTMTVEFAHRGVRTNVLAPGFLDTPANATHWRHPTRAPWILDRTPMARPGHPAEMVGPALLLASDAGSFISGQTIYVDGGFTAGSRWDVPSGTGQAEYQAWVDAGRPSGPRIPGR